MALPVLLSDVPVLTLMQNKWVAQLNPLLARPQNNSLILKEISLTTGSNTINHMLGKKIQGYKLTRQRAAASIYDTQDANPTPELTLVLVSSANVVVDIEVF